jgi:flavin-binding protein dodecin
VEKFIQRPGAKFGFRRDLFKVIDIVAVSEESTLGVQSGAISGRKSHIDKIYSAELLDNTLKWIRGPRIMWLISWRKEKVKRGGVAFRYKPVIDLIGPTGPVDITEQILAMPLPEIEVMEIP